MTTELEVKIKEIIQRAYEVIMQEQGHLKQLLDLKANL